MNHYTPSIKTTHESNTAITAQVAMTEHEQGDWLKADDAERVLREIVGECVECIDSQRFNLRGLEAIQAICQKHLGGDE